MQRFDDHVGVLLLGPDYVRVRPPAGLSASPGSGVIGFNISRFQGTRPRPGAAALLRQFGPGVRALVSSGEADALVVTLVATRTKDRPGALAALTEAADDHPYLPIVAVVVGADSPLKLDRGNLPVHQLSEDTVRSLGHAYRCARWRPEPASSKPALPGIDPDQDAAAMWPELHAAPLLTATAARQPWTPMRSSS